MLIELRYFQVHASFGYGTKISKRRLLEQGARQGDGYEDCELSRQTTGENTIIDNIMALKAACLKLQGVTKCAHEQGTINNCIMYKGD